MVVAAGNIHKVLIEDKDVLGEFKQKMLKDMERLHSTLVRTLTLEFYRVL